MAKNNFINSLKKGKKKAIQNYKKSKKIDKISQPDKPKTATEDIMNTLTKVTPLYYAAKNNKMLIPAMNLAADVLAFTPLVEVAPVVKVATGTIEKVLKLKNKVKTTKAKAEKVANTFDNGDKIIDKSLKKKVLPVHDLPNFQSDTSKAMAKSRKMINNPTKVNPTNGYIRMLDKLKVLNLWGLYKDEIEDHVQRAGLTSKMPVQLAINYVGAAVCDTGLLDNRAYIYDSEGTGASIGFTQVLLFIDTFIDTKLEDIVEEYGEFNPNRLQEQRTYEARQQAVRDQRNARRREQRARRKRQ